MNANDLAIFAVESNRISSIHKKMAKRNISFSHWICHIKLIVLPLYRIEHMEPYEGLNLAEIKEATKIIIRYHQPQNEEIIIQNSNCGKG